MTSSSHIWNELDMVKVRMRECWSGVGRLCEGQESRAAQETEQRAKFEQVVLFLKSVPLFRKQLPPAELVKVAEIMQERTWIPGKKIIVQGETGTSFYLIYSGQASVISTDASGKERERAVLAAGDWLGGHTLISNRPNVATVVAKGPQRLVTLQMSKRQFEAAGLRHKLQFPKRPAMFRTDFHKVAHGALGSCHDGEQADLRSDQETAFILKAITRNPNLKPLIDSLSSNVGSAGQVMKDIAATAERRSVPKGSVVTKIGELGQEFFIICAGEVAITIPGEGQDTGQRRSAEAAMATVSMAERLRRKLDFMVQLHIPMPQEAFKSSRKLATSVILKDPRKSQGQAAMWRNQRSNSICGMPMPAAPPQQEKTENGDIVLSKLGECESFGELSLLYNTRREATFTAGTDTVLFVIGQKEFRQFVHQKNGHKRFQEVCQLLEEVNVLTPLLRTEVIELACSMSDMVTFSPGQRILHQDHERKMSQWYVIHSGSAILSKDIGGMTQEIAQLYRGGHFGEMSGHDPSAHANVDAGSHGLTCVTFDSELIQKVMKAIVFNDSDKEACEAQQANYERDEENCSPVADVSQLEDLSEVCRLGEGGFGTVFLARSEEDGRYALKRISKGLVTQLGIQQQLCWERDLLSLLGSPFIVHLLCTYRDDQFIYLLMEAVLGGDLYQLMRTRGELFFRDEPHGSATAFYVACLIAALEHLHERKIVYRDAKPENILLDEMGYGKLCDMGLARFVCGKTNTQVGTPDYMAPEIIDPPHYHDASADWWSVGVLAFELICGQTPFDDEGLEDTEERLLAIRRSQEHGDLHFTPDCPPAAKLFIAQLLRRLPWRLGANGGAKAVRKHQFFQQLHFDFDALHKRELPAPIRCPWTEPNKEHGEGWVQFAVKDDDPFVKYEDDDSNWDRDF